ncbi:hypothetical protein BKA93DRAFT_252505 [Sparassis latifolia]
MSALSDASTPAQDGLPPSIDTQHLQQPQLTSDLQSQQGLQNGASPTPNGEGSRKRLSLPTSSPSLSLICFRLLAKAPSVRRACTACHTGKTRCSEVLPCQVCLLSTPTTAGLWLSCRAVSREG